jgi:hypothetical protein
MGHNSADYSPHRQVVLEWRLQMWGLLPKHRQTEYERRQALPLYQQTEYERREA